MWKPNASGVQRQKKIIGALNIYCVGLHIFYPMKGDIHPHPSLAVRLPPNKHQYSKHHTVLIISPITVFACRLKGQVERGSDYC